MKKLIYLALMTLFTFSCTQKDLISPQKCTLDDLVGTWIWIFEDGKNVPNSKIEIGTINADGTEDYWKIIDDKWTETTYPISISEGIIYLGDVGECYIVNYDFASLTIESKTDKKRYTAQRVIQRENNLFYGTWICDDYKLTESMSLSHYQVVLNPDNTYVMTYDNAEPITGKYYLCNDFMIYQSNRAGCIYLTFDVDDSGPICKHTVINEDGKMTENIMRLLQPKKEFTLNDVIGIWLTVDKDGQRIPIREATICTAEDNSGHTVISGIENDKWVSKDVLLTIKDNIVTRVIDGVTDSYTILYFDSQTIVWGNNQDGSVVTRKNIKQDEDYSKLISGYWKSDEIEDPFGEGDSSDKITLEFRSKGDSAIFTTTNQDGVKDTRRRLGKIYGDIMVLYDDVKCHSFFRFSFGYDAERKEQFMRHRILNQQGDIIDIKLYKPDLDTKLSGGWIWTTEDGEEVPTAELELSFFNSNTGMHSYQIFGDEAEHILEPYYLEGRTIFYPKDTEVPYETIMKVDDNELVIVGPDGIPYGAARIFKDNPLNEEIIGKWDCPNFINQNSNNSFTHIFDKNGLVTCIIDETTTIYGTYRLYNSLLVMQFTYNSEIKSVLWIIKDNHIDNDTMTFYQLLEDGTSIENVLTKK